MDLPSISIVIPTFNSDRTLDQCLKSIRSQDYPKNKIELILIDAASSDRTLSIAKKYRADKILKNPLITGEAGKSVGVKAARNEIIALIDSDNILVGKDWLKRMTEPFKDKRIVGTEPIAYSHRRQDPLITRYSALIGANDPLCIYLGNYDRLSLLTGRWTDSDVNVKDKGTYLEVSLDEKNLPTIGANGFLVRRTDLLETSFQPYLFDIDVVYELVKSGKNKIAKVKVPIIHLFSGSLGLFIRKQWRRIRDYKKYKEYRKYPWKKTSKLRLLTFILSTLLILPLLVDSLRGYRKVHDRAWFFHIPACWITLIVYFFGLVRYR